MGMKVGKKKREKERKRKDIPYYQKVSNQH
jgi:hypothetical protein